jgi:biopolymer transport protein ExbD
VSRWHLSFCLLAVACAEPPPDLRFPPLDLPRVGTIGWHARDLPSPVAVVNMHRDGRLTVDGETVKVVGLVERLHPVAKARRDLAHPSQPSLAFLVLRCDRDVPWGAVQQVMQAACDPSNRMNRLLFGVLPEDGWEEGTLALYLALDKGILSDPADRGLRDAWVRVGLSPGDGPAVTPASLAAALTIAGGIRSVGLACRPDVSVGDVLSVADALLRAKVTPIELREWPSPGLSRAVPTVPAPASGLAIKVSGLEIPRSGPVDLPPELRVAGLAGSAKNYVRLDPLLEEGDFRDDVNSGD